MGSKNEIRYGSGFFKDASKLPRQAREKLALLIVILEENPFDSRLHTKQLSQPLQDMYSFRITRDWRAIFQFIDNGIQLIAADHRSKIYQRLKRLL